MQFDSQENKILKVTNERWGGVNTIEMYYNANGQIIKNRMIDNNERYYYYYNNIYETDYEYDSLNREIKKTKKTIRWSVYKQDTTKVIDVEIDEYVYNSNNQKIEWYKTVDKRKTTKYFTTKRKPKTKYECFRCSPRYLDTKWVYDSLSNLTEEFIFTSDYLNSIYSKSNYFYDDQNRIMKRIDSIFCLPPPRCEQTFMYEYTDTGKIETRIYNRQEYTIYFYYDNEDKIVKECYDRDYNFNEECTEYFYFYENDKLTKKRIDKYFGATIEKMYFYNEKGLLREEQKKENDKIIKLIRYYYE